MKKLLLSMAIALFAVSSASALDPIKVALVNTGGAAVNVQVNLTDYTAGGAGVNIYTGNAVAITPNASGILIAEVNDATYNSGTLWSVIDPANVNNYYVLDIYVTGALSAQYRLDALLLEQGQGGIFDAEGDLTPIADGASDLGKDDNRWGELFVRGNTIHVGPSGGTAGNTELALGYNAGTATLNVDNTSALTATSAGVTIPGTLTQTAGQVAFGGNVDMNDGLDVLTGNLNVGSTNVDPANGNTLIGGTLQVTGTSTLNGNTSVSGANTFTVGTGQATFGGNIVIDTKGLSVSNADNAISFGKPVDNHQTNETAYGVNAAQANTGTNVTAFGVNAANGNDKNNATAFGNNAGQNNSGLSLTAVGNNAGRNNTSFAVTVVGNNAGQTNTGTAVTAIGNNAANGNTGSNVLAIGNGAGNGNTKSAVTILANASLPSFVDRAAAVASLSVGAIAGNTYLYYNQTSFAIEGYRP